MNLKMADNNISFYTEEEDTQATEISRSDQTHVPYILTAEFDVDAGPIISHTYPESIGGSVSQMLAELMLPDQVHNREEDWTVFFLHISDEGQGDSESSLMYVLSLVNKKLDQTVKRGAVVKAIGICTRHPFLHIYKPLLVLALEEYFISPTESTLAHLYDSLNEMDLSQMPSLNYLERTVLIASDNKDMFREKFLFQPDEQASPQSTHSRELSQDSRRRTFINLTSGNRFQLPSQAGPKDCHFFETKIVYTGRKIPIQIPITGTPDIVGDFSVIRLINCFSGPHLSSPQPFPLHPHLTTSGPLTHPIIVLINAMLTRKRIVFIGYGLPSGEVAHFVLAACAIASGVNGMLRGITERAFPYTDLSKVDELIEQPGYIAGVTNPLFENHPEWWDLLLNVDTGRIRISSNIEPVTQTVPELFPTPPSSDPTGDIAFMEEIQRMIANRISESFIRNRFKDWLWRFIRKAAAYEEMTYREILVGVEKVTNEEGFIVRGHGLVWPDEASKLRELAPSQMRFEGFREALRTRKLYLDWELVYSITEIVKTMDVHHQLDRLKVQKNLSLDDSAFIYLALHSEIESYDQINLLLSALPVGHGELTCLALGLFHPYKKVRFAVADLLERIDEHPAGQHFITAMNGFQKICFEQVLSERERTNGVNGAKYEPLNGDGIIPGMEELSFEIDATKF